jgi:hypothetical protein
MYRQYLEESNSEFQKLKNSYEGKYYDIENKYGVNNPIEKALVSAKYNLSQKGINAKKIGYYKYKKELLKEQEEIFKEYFNRAEKLKKQNNNHLGVFFILRILRVVSNKIQKTVEFYSIVYVDINDE